MAKKTSKILILAAAVGAAAAGISYFTKYRSFSKELDEDFHDFEDDEEPPVPDSTMNRNYVSLHADKDAAGAAKNVVMDAAAIVTDTAKDAMNAAVDTAAAARANFTGAAEDTADKAEDVTENLKEAVTEAAENTATITMEDDESDHPELP